MCHIPLMLIRFILYSAFIPLTTLASLSSAVRDYNNTTDVSARNQLQIDIVNRHLGDKTNRTNLQEFLEHELYEPNGSKRANTAWLILNVSDIIDFPPTVLVDAFLEFQLHSEFLLNLDGIKPISITQEVLNDIGYNLGKLGLFSPHRLGVLNYGRDKDLLIYSLSGLCLELKI